MESRQTRLQELLEENTVVLQNLSGIKQDLGTLLSQTTTIYYKNCQDMEIVVGSKINRVVLDGCTNIKIRLSGLIAGLNIKDCKNLYVSNSRGYPLNFITAYNSDCIKVATSKNLHKMTHYNVDRTIVVHNKI